MFMCAKNQGKLLHDILRGPATQGKQAEKQDSLWLKTDRGSNIKSVGGRFSATRLSKTVAYA